MKTVLVTGCSSGIGRATARAFHDAGWRTYATARDPTDVGDLADAGCVTPALDVTDDAAVNRVVARVADEGEGIDCLVNNAGYGQFGPLEDVPVADLHAQFDVNVYGTHRCCRAALPHMREAGSGTIVTVSSVLGRIALPGTGAYAGSKWAVEAMSDSLRLEVEPHGIDVVLVEPGPVRTAFTERATEEADDVERTPAYDRLYGLLDDFQFAGSTDLGTVSPERVALAIRAAATRSNPPPRVPVGALARIGILAGGLPDRVRDPLVGLASRVLG